MDHASWRLLVAMCAAGRRLRTLARVLSESGLESALADPGFSAGPSSLRRAERIARILAAMEITFVPQWAFPRRLLRQRPPAALFVRGAPELLSRPALAVVGARGAGIEARRWAASIAADAARRGWLVVSGGARGADRAAHEGALAAGAPTLAYLGVAADEIYPAAHQPLFARILGAGGALVSEHPPGSATYAHDHSERNRFIGSHASAVFVAEAAPGSGSLGTARAAQRARASIWIPPAEVGGERGGLDDLVAERAAAVWPRGLGLPAPPGNAPEPADRAPAKIGCKVDADMTIPP